MALGGGDGAVYDRQKAVGEDQAPTRAVFEALVLNAGAGQAGRVDCRPGTRRASSPRPRRLKGEGGKAAEDECLSSWQERDPQFQGSRARFKKRKNSGRERTRRFEFLGWSELTEDSRGGGSAAWWLEVERTRAAADVARRGLVLKVGVARGRLVRVCH